MKAIHLLLLLVCVLSTKAQQQFTPGCSFFNGQCVYNVKLGQTGQCDAVGGIQSHSTSTSTSSSQPSGSCTCADVQSVKTDVDSLKASVAKLQAAVGALNQRLNITNAQLTQTTSDLNVASQTNSDLLSVLQNKQALLGMTKTELVNVMQNASAEITHLRDELKKENTHLTLCQTALHPGVAPHPTSKIHLIILKLTALSYKCAN